MNHPPTDPIRALLEAAAKTTPREVLLPARRLIDQHLPDALSDGLFEAIPEHIQITLAQADTSLKALMEFCSIARNCIPALTALVNEREQVRALVATWRNGLSGMSEGERTIYVDYRRADADDLAAIVEWRGSDEHIWKTD